MTPFDGPRGDLATPSGGLGTAACLALTVLALSTFTGCAPTEGALACHGDRDCPAGLSVCRCDGRCWATPLDADAADAPIAGTYVIAAIRSQSDDLTTAYGVNLDGRDSGMTHLCTDQPDHVSVDTGETGIDNQFATGVGLGTLDAYIGPDGWDGALADAIEAGQFAIVLEVSEVPTEGCARRVHAWSARFVSGAVPDPNRECATPMSQPECASVAGACTWFSSAGNCAGLAPGQAWVGVDDLGEVGATVLAGRFRTQPFARVPLAPFVTPVGHPGMLAPIDVHDAVIEADLGEGTLTRGDIGGAIHVIDAFVWVNTYLGPTDLTTLSAIVAPDLAPSADGRTCADISAGFGFTAIAATLVH